MGKRRQTYWAGFDLGGTKMMATVFDGAFKVLGSAKAKTPVNDGAQAVQARIRAWQGGATDEDLDTIARRYGDPPLSLRQLQRIISSQTEAARLAADDENLASDMSSRPMTARWQHQPPQGPRNEKHHHQAR